MVSRYALALVGPDGKLWVEFCLECLFDIFLLGTAIALLFFVCQTLLRLVICSARFFGYVQRAVHFTCSFFIRYVQMRMSITPVTVKSDVSLQGTVKWDATGPYISTIHLGKTIRVNVAVDGLLSLLLKPPGSVVDETQLADSQVDEMAFHKGTVQFLVNGKLIGFGFRTTVRGRDVIVTALHNLRSLIGREVYMAGPRGQFRLPTNTVYAKYPVLDFVCLEFSDMVYTTLGVKTLKIAAPGSVGTPIRVHGYMDGSRVRTIGVISGVVKGSPGRFKHTASTVEGFSGSPVFNATGQVVGMHLRGNVGYNEAVALTWFVGVSESDIPEKLFSRMDEIEDGYDAVCGFEDGVMQRVRFRGRVFMSPEEVNVWEYNPEYSSWADDENEAWWDLAMNEGREEAASVEGAETLNGSPVVLPEPQVMEGTSGIESLDIPTLTLAEKSDLERSRFCAWVNTPASALQPKASKGARNRANRQLRKLAAGHGLQQTLEPVTAPSTPIALESKAASTQPRIRYPEQFQQLCGAACFHAPMSQRDYERVKHLVSAYETGVVPRSESSRLRSEWAALWTK